MITAEHDFADSAALASALAGAVATSLRHGLQEKERVCLAVSGGKTPQRFFDKLSHEKLDWSRVIITLVDERQVPETSPRSNAALLRQHLLRHEAKSAHFVPLYHNEADAAELIIDVAVLGMGSDGHTASFFPGGDHLAQALDPQQKIRLLTIEAPAAGEPRLTFSYAALRQAKAIYLHIEGAEKREVLQQALKPGEVMAMPIRAFLRDDQPLIVYWCP